MFSKEFVGLSYRDSTVWMDHLSLSLGGDARRQSSHTPKRSLTLRSAIITRQGRGLVNSLLYRVLYGIRYGRMRCDASSRWRRRGSGWNLEFVGLESSLGFSAGVKLTLLEYHIYTSLVKSVELIGKFLRIVTGWFFFQ